MTQDAILPPEWTIPDIGVNESLQLLELRELSVKAARAKAQGDKTEYDRIAKIMLAKWRENQELVKTCGQQEATARNRRKAEERKQYQRGMNNKGRAAS